MYVSVQDVYTHNFEEFGDAYEYLYKNGGGCILLTEHPENYPGKHFQNTCWEINLQGVYVVDVNSPYGILIKC